VARTVRLLRPRVEGPALSPDNRRIAFKRRFGGVLTPVSWRLTVLDLQTAEEASSRKHEPSTTRRIGLTIGT
jgi:hypothetical protein